MLCDFNETDRQYFRHPGLTISVLQTRLIAARIGTARSVEVCSKLRCSGWLMPLRG